MARSAEITIRLKQCCGTTGERYGGLTGLCPEGTIMGKAGDAVKQRFSVRQYPYRHRYDRFSRETGENTARDGLSADAGQV